jgi:putative NADH-flavin reductase
MNSAEMKIALIGATGFVGRALMEEALQRGHQVTAIVRRPEDTGGREGLTMVKGDVMDTDALADLLKGNDVVISAYNAGWSNPNLYTEYLAGLRSIQQAVKKAGIKRYIVCGGAGSLYVDGRQLVDSPSFPEAWKSGALAARDYLDILKKEDKVDWTFVSPAIEMNESMPHGRRGVYRTALDSPVFDAENKSTISVEDLAVAILDEAEHPVHVRQRFTVGY